MLHTLHFSHEIIGWFDDICDSVPRKLFMVIAIWCWYNLYLWAEAQYCMYPSTLWYLWILFIFMALFNRPSIWAFSYVGVNSQCLLHFFFDCLWSRLLHPNEILYMVWMGKSRIVWWHLTLISNFIIISDCLIFRAPWYSYILHLRASNTICLSKLWSLWVL